MYIMHIIGMIRLKIVLYYMKNCDIIRLHDFKRKIKAKE